MSAQTYSHPVLYHTFLLKRIKLVKFRVGSIAPRKVRSWGTSKY